MKAVILAGGLGTRISEESHLRPKPMINIGGKPILWHILKIYSTYGIYDFIVCCGYKGYMIKEYFANYFLHMSDVTFHMSSNKMEVHQNSAEPWRVTLVDTGLKTMTGGRLKQVEKYIFEDTFCMTYGDCVGNIDINALIKLHKEQGTQATVTAVQPTGRYGALEVSGKKITKFVEKPKVNQSWISGGFFVLEPSVLDLIEDDNTTWEREPLELLAKKNQLSVFKHTDFWYPMDTMRDKSHLEKLWGSGNAPWKVWE